MRERLTINAIGEKISLKFQNTANNPWQIDDIGFHTLDIDRKDSIPTNIVSHHISLKIQGYGIESEDYLTTEAGDTLITEDGGSIIAWAGAESDFMIKYIQIPKEKYPNQ